MTKATAMTASFDDDDDDKNDDDDDDDEEEEERQSPMAIAANCLDDARMIRWRHSVPRRHYEARQVSSCSRVSLRGQELSQS